MEYLPSYSDDLYLAHHGIKGQKWGVRRYQNPNGSLTDAGKKRIARKAQRKLNRIDREKVQSLYDIDKYERKAQKQLTRDKKKEHAHSQNTFLNKMRVNRIKQNEERIEWAKLRRESINMAAKARTDDILETCKREKLSVATKESMRFVDTGWRIVYSNYNAKIPIYTMYDGGTKYKVSAQ